VDYRGNAMAKISPAAASHRGTPKSTQIERERPAAGVGGASPESFVDESPTPRQPVHALRPARVGATLSKGDVAPHATLLAAVMVAIVAALAIGINLTGFPYHENDEGTYVAQAWAVATLGRLAPYTYTYDHAPLGWITIAAWTSVIGGAQRFGTAIDTARALMAIIQVAATLVVFQIGLRMSGRIWVGVLASLLFAVTPVGLYYHRRVLLDNLATLWLLVSLWLLIPFGGRSDAAPRPVSLRRAILSALAFGGALLTKEVVVAALPAVALLALRPAPGPWRWRALLAWLVVSGLAVMLYPLSAALRGELLPGGASGVSLLGALSEQIARGRDGGLLSPDSEFWRLMGRWAREEPLLVLGGTVSALWLVARWRFRPAEASVGLAALGLWLFLGRGGIVLPFYLVPGLPLLALSLAIAVATLTRTIARPSLARLTPALTVTAGVLLLAPGLTSQTLGFGGDPLTLWTNRQADAQREAVGWLRANVPPSGRIVADDALWLDLRDGGFQDVHPYWKVERDPTIRREVFGDRWQAIEYVVVSPQLREDIRTADFALIPLALEHAETVAQFDTGGWPLEVLRVRP
jgi:4-amino-4-deoxy-L-arabinose transferase-like glycosyltransferase